MAFGEAVQWAVNGDNYKLSGEVAKKLPPGAYNCADDGWGHAMLSKTNLNLDELISFPDSLFSGVVDRITKFWTKERQYYNYGFLHKMGYLLYGPQGCGKSSLVYQILNNIVDAGHLCLLCDGRVDHFIECVQAVRQVEPKRPMVCVLEDIDALIDRYGDGELLQWLDGANKTDHVVVIATTNYPEKLDKRIVCRPRRFDRLIKVMPWGFVAVTPTSATVGGGWTFGSAGRVRPGLWGDITHAYDISQGQPDFEAAGSLTIMFGRWFLSPSIGAGVSIALNSGEASWSGRVFLTLSQTTPVAAQIQWFAMMGLTTTSDWMSKLSAGVSIQIGDSGLRIFPNLGLAISSPGSNGNLGVNIIPATALFF
jgi:hypothetical protein